MADKMVALVGPGTGPLMHTSRMGHLLVKLREVAGGSVKIRSENGITFHSVDSDVKLEPSPFVQIAYDGTCRRFQCIIQSNPNALHRA
jgi:hypothetical protein